MRSRKQYVLLSVLKHDINERSDGVKEESEMKVREKAPVFVS